MLVYVPGLNRLFSMAPVSWPELLVLPAGAVAPQGNHIRYAMANATRGR